MVAWCSGGGVVRVRCSLTLPRCVDVTRAAASFHCRFQAFVDSEGIREYRFRLRGNKVRVIYQV